MKLIFESRIDATAKDLWQFHQSAEALEALTPWPIRIEIVGDAKVVTGARQEIISTAIFVRTRWLARIEIATEPSGFIDVAERSPFRRWRHEHIFEDGVLRDIIDFEANGGVIGTAVASVLIRALFAFRHNKTRRALAVKARD